MPPKRAPPRVQVTTPTKKRAHAAACSLPDMQFARELDAHMVELVKTNKQQALLLKKQSLLLEQQRRNITSVQTNMRELRAVHDTLLGVTRALEHAVRKETDENAIILRSLKSQPTTRLQRIVGCLGRGVMDFARTAIVHYMYTRHLPPSVINQAILTATRSATKLPRALFRSPHPPRHTTRSTVLPID